MLNSGNQDHLTFGEASELRRGPADRRVRKGDATRREFQRVDRERRRIAGLYQALSQANQAIVHATNQADLYHEVCRVCAECIPLDLAFISRPDPTGGRGQVVCGAGRLAVHMGGIGTDPSSGLGEQVSQDWDLERESGLWREAAVSLGIRSSARFPLGCEGRRVGALNLYSAIPGFFAADRLDLLREITGDTSFALERFARDAHRQEAEEAFRATFEQAAVGITHVGLGGQFLKLNPRFLEMLGYSEKEFLGRPVRDFTEPEDRAQDNREVRALLAGSRSSSCWEKRYLRKDGTPVWVRVTSSLLHDQAGSPTFFVNVIEDLTSHRQANAERLELMENLHQAQKMESLGTLSAGIAHDMNNVLAAIMGTAEVLQLACASNPAMAGHLTTIIRASDRGRDLVGNLTAFARKGLKKAQLLDLNELVRNEIDLLGRTTLKKVDVQSDLAPDLPPILGEPSAISGALMNLCVNAVTAMPEGGTLAFRTVLLPESWVELEVTDSGQGMPPGVLAKALEPFFTTQAVGKGTGLGLSIAFAVLKSHGGTLDIRSDPGHGTTVTLRFPGAAGRVEQAAHQPMPAAQKPLNVLMVDDDILLLDIIPQVLRTMGHTTAIAGSGQEALEVLAGGEAFDLVILDQNMPGLSGTRTLERIRERWPELPVIIGTGYLEAPSAARIAGTKHVLVLQKPYSAMELRLAIERVLGST